MDPRNYIEILWRRKWVIVISVFVTIFIVILATIRTIPIYSATTTMRIALANSGSVSYQDYMYADRLLNTYVDLAMTSPVLDQLKKRLDLTSIPSINVNTVPNTELIQITVQDSDPNRGAQVANTLADILISQSSELYTGGGKSSIDILGEQASILEQQVNQAQTEYMNTVTNNPNDAVAIQSAKEKWDLEQQMYASVLDQYEQARLKQSQRANSVSVVNQATPSSVPSKPNKILNIGLGLVVGMFSGLGLAFLFENFDKTLYTIDQIQKVTDLPIIGKIPSARQKGLFGLFTKTNKINNLVLKGSFQNLQAKISLLNARDHPIKSILFTSAVPGEGKSTVVSNLALTMAKAGQKVVVVDCDMHLSTQHKIFGLPNKLGLSSLLTQQAGLIDVLQKSRNSNAWILTSGPIIPNAMELLGSPQMKSVIELLLQKFDYVLLDTPALLPIGDAITLSSVVDAIVLVTRQSYCKEDDLREISNQLSDLNPRIIGMVVNDTNQTRSYYYGKSKLS